jgi:Domain of unknown function (DUF397)
VSSIVLSDALWRKSSYSNGQANCVETTSVGQGRCFVAVRDSKAPDGSKLILAAPVWRQFVDAMKAVHQGS